jgi:hypothetical protein
MQIQSNPLLAMDLDRWVPGSICQAPKDKPLPLNNAPRSLLELFMTDAMVLKVDSKSGDEHLRRC